MAYHDPAGVPELVHASAATLPIERLPRGPGVYRFKDSRGRVLYIGRAAALRSRVASYWSDLRERAHLAAMLTLIAQIEAVSCDSIHEAAWLERNLLEASLPPWNKTPGGQENVVYIRLDARASAPRLAVEHLRQPGQNFMYFGPYLGGRRARLAVAALNRIFPLSYACARSRGAQLDMARARGVTSSDREDLVRAITAVLQRRQDAVVGARTELQQLRDRAAGRLSFELAGRIHSEVQALDWITCPQRATTMDPSDFDVYGWSDDVLVRFGIRGGRFRAWSRHSCPRSRAEPLLAATPADWIDFANRNAALAAALAQR